MFQKLYTTATTLIQSFTCSAFLSLNSHIDDKEVSIASFHTIRKDPLDLKDTGPVVCISEHMSFKCLDRQSLRAHLHVVGMLQFMSNINQPSLPTPFDSVLASVSVFMGLSTVFHSINSQDNSPFSYSVHPVLSLPYWSFQLYVSL